MAKSLSTAAMAAALFALIAASTVPSIAALAPPASAASALIVPPTYALFGLAAQRASQPATANNRPLFSIPSIFNAADSRPVVLFDGKCNMCNAGVQLILDYDRASSDPRGNLRVAALQSRVGKVLLARLPKAQRDSVLSVGGEDGSKEFKSIVVAGKDRTWLNSAACIKIGRELKGPLRYLSLLASLIPAFIRDPLYKLLSKHRKRFFGEAPECRLWDDNWDMRFVDDAMFGGRSSEVDPFADPNAPQEEVEDDDDDVEVEDAPVGSPPLNAGDTVRVISPRPILHSNEELCSVGMTGTVSRVLERRAYPKNVAVKFDVDGSDAFEAHFFPGQLRKE